MKQLEIFNLFLLIEQSELLLIDFIKIEYSFHIGTNTKNCIEYNCKNIRMSTKDTQKIQFKEELWKIILHAQGKALPDETYRSIFFIVKVLIFK